MSDYALSTYARLEPASPSEDLDGGFAAPLADPAWLLGRQWQLGEHQGEDAGSPVRADFDVRIGPLRDGAGRDAVHTPTEALIEAAPGQWWTPGRRIRIGNAVERRAASENEEVASRLADPSLRVSDLPPPYAHANGRVLDGRAIHARRAELGVPGAWFGELPPEADVSAAGDDAWDPARFEYRATVATEGIDLHIDRHDGGRVDWYSCAAELRDGGAGTTPETGCAVPTRLDYAGAPAPRWWQIENRQFDIGGFPPDRSHFATLLLIDVVSSHSDDWFVVPVDTATPSVGRLVTVERLCVIDSFDQEHELIAPADGWSLCHVAGLADGWTLPVFPMAAVPVHGRVLDQVDIGIDEDANLAWAMERRLSGVDTADLAPARRPPWPLGERARSPGAVPQRYDPTSPLRRHWHPYVLDPSLVVARLRLIPESPATLAPGDPLELQLWYAAGFSSRWLVSVAMAGASFTPMAQAELPASSGAWHAVTLRGLGEGTIEAVRLQAWPERGTDLVYEEILPVHIVVRGVEPADAVRLLRVKIDPESPARLDPGQPITVRFTYTSRIEARWIVQGWTADGVGRSLGNVVLPPTDEPATIERRLPGLADGQRYVRLIVRAWTDGTRHIEESITVDYRFGGA